MIIKNNFFSINVKILEKENYFDTIHFLIIYNEISALSEQTILEKKIWIKKTEIIKFLAKKSNYLIDLDSIKRIEIIENRFIIDFSTVSKQKIEKKINIYLIVDIEFIELFYKLFNEEIQQF